MKKATNVEQISSNGKYCRWFRNNALNELLKNTL